MEQNQEKSKFCQKARQFAVENEAEVSQEGSKKALIVIAVDSGIDESKRHCDISIMGRHGDLIHGLACFLNDNSKLMKEAVMLSIIKGIKSKFEEDKDDEEDND